ncbi:uncharacterized protein LOC134694030 [Mytilus trossulus]|uniref:uncharacterized protein LOC134694030 n=1 Tax=Mytilus trossulus TaxID=6551 RepID=UPI003007A8C7
MDAAESTNASLLKHNFTDTYDYPIDDDSYIVSDLHLLLISIVSFCAFFVILFSCFCMVRTLPADHFTLSWISSYVSTAPDYASVHMVHDNKKDKKYTNYKIKEGVKESQL